MLRCRPGTVTHTAFCTVPGRHCNMTQKSVMLQCARDTLISSVCVSAGVQRAFIPDVVTGVDQLAAQEVERRFVVEHDVVKRIGDDFRDPYEAGLHVLDDEELNHPEQ